MTVLDSRRDTASDSALAAAGSHIPVAEPGPTAKSTRSSDRNSSEAATAPGTTREKYRDQLLQSALQAQDELDKTILKLSGGALGISLAFINNIVGDGPYIWKIALLISWSLFCLSMASVLGSYYLSAYSHRRAVAQLDIGSIYKEKPGGWFDSATEWLNGLAALMFLVGLILMIVFVYKNV